jgi:hypothetical protein
VTDDEALKAAIAAGLWAAAHAPCPKCGRIPACRCLTGGRKPTEAAIRAVWDLAVAHGRELESAACKEKLNRLRDYRPDGGCRTCPGRIGHRPRPHAMYCRLYVGPLEHRWIRKDRNGTFGGTDHDCLCGGWFRRGGLAGHGDGTEDAEVVCPNADQDWRGPRPDGGTP